MPSITCETPSSGPVLDPMLVDLCETILEDLYGSMAAKVVHILSRMGRLTVDDISRYTKVHTSAVLRTLTSLVQVQLVLFWEDEKLGKTFYSANLNKIYSCIRAGWIMSTHQSAFPTCAASHASKILSTLLICGSMKVKDLAETCTCAEQDIQEMFKNNLLLEARPSDFWPMIDLTTHVKRQCYNKLISDPSGLAFSDAAKKIQVQASMDVEMSNYTRRDRLGDSLASTAPVMINEERYLAVGRREALASFVSLRIGAVTARVYEQVLIASETNIYSLKQKRIPSPETNVSTNFLVPRLEGIDLASAFEQPNTGPRVKDEEGEQDVEQANKRQKLVNGVNPMIRLSVNELVNRHLQLLEESPIRFLRKAGDRGGGEWFVPFDQVMDDMKRITFDSIIKDKFGLICARLLRVVREQVKVDEKYLGQVALVQQRDIRREMTKLQLFGFVDLQEVPRGNDRAPGRNFYFWYHRPAKAYQRLVDELYGSMSEIYAELDTLRKQNGILLAKLSRQDVQNDLEKYLTPAEKTELQKFQEKEQELVSRIMLIDGQVRLFRDY